MNKPSGAQGRGTSGSLRCHWCFDHTHRVSVTFPRPQLAAGSVLGLLRLHPAPAASPALPELSLPRGRAQRARRAEPAGEAFPLPSPLRCHLLQFPSYPGRGGGCQTG